ncbi:LOW QUALITY PROTEIN: hypothetical protein U9M48_000747, partial [Paspalum notatum var. saurae]
QNGNRYATQICDLGIEWDPSGIYPCHLDRSGGCTYVCRLTQAGRAEAGRSRTNESKTRPRYCLLQPFLRPQQARLQPAITAATPTLLRCWLSKPSSLILSDPCQKLDNQCFLLSMGWSLVQPARQHVTALSLPDVPLQGSLSPHLGNLSFLSLLNLTSTGLSGSIRVELVELEKLRRRRETNSLGFNSLSGEIPVGLLQNMLNLQKFSVARNELSGHIPPYLFNNTASLQYITLVNNSLSGPIPYGIGSLVQYPQPSITCPGYKDYALQVTVSQDLFQTIKAFSLFRNNFGSQIPTGLAACQYLEVLDLSLNYFVDVVPTWLSQLPHLTQLSLGGNNLVGPIPVVLSNLTCPTALALLFNQLTDPIPSFLGNFSELTLLSLGSNQLSGSVPPAVGNIPSLIILSLLSNHLDGDLGFLFSLSKCRKLQLLELSNNVFIGEFPDHIGNLSTDLLLFGTAYNKLTGRFPSTFSNLSNLQSLGLDSNLLTGGSITGMHDLTWPYISDNDLSVPIPTQIGMLRRLQRLCLGGNKLFGSIPDSTGNLTLLEYVILSDNQLSSSIPASLFQLDKLSFSQFLCGFPPS